MEITNLNDRQLAQMKINVTKLTSYMEKAYTNKLTSQRSVCGFQLLPPINNRDYTIVVFHGTPVAYIYGRKKIDINGFNKVTWGKVKYKFDVLCEITKKLVGEEEPPIKEPLNIDLGIPKVINSSNPPNPEDPEVGGSTPLGGEKPKVIKKTVLRKKKVIKKKVIRKPKAKK